MLARKLVSISLLALSLALLSYRPACAALDSNDRYAVEVVVFANTGPDTSNGELWVGEHLLPNLTGAVNPDPVADPNSPMKSVVALLTASPDYRVLYHNRWIQIVGSKSATPAEHITNAQPAAGDLPAFGTVNGFIRLFRTRFMVLNADIAYRPTTTDTSYDSAQDHAAPTYVLDQTRRVAAKEIHYFDHPKFGVLVYITAAPKPKVMANPGPPAAAKPAAPTQP